MITDQAIIRQIERQPHRSAGYKQLIREMTLRGEDRRELAERFGALVKSGELVETGRDCYTMPEQAAAQHNLIAGRLTMHRDGYGFVIPNPGQRSTIEGDIFIPPRDWLGHARRPGAGGVGRRKRDRASRGTDRPRDDARPSDRGRHISLRQHGKNYVTPIDEKVTKEIVIPQGMEWLNPTHSQETN